MCLPARNKNELSSNDNDSSNVKKINKKGKFKEKLKEKKSKKLSKKDADKDVDETEVKSKRHIKRKWFWTMSELLLYYNSKYKDIKHLIFNTFIYICIFNTIYLLFKET